MASVLIIEDDLPFLRLLENFLLKNGHSVNTGTTVKEATKQLSQGTFDMVLADYRLPDGNGIDIVMEARREVPGTAVVIMTSFNDVRTAVTAIQSGARDYVLKPVHPDELLLLLSNVLLARSTGLSGRRNPSEMRGYVAGSSAQASQLQQHLELVAPTSLSVVIEGESGTGKEYIAKMIHRLSARSAGPFIAMDCGTLSNELATSILFGHVKGSFTGAIADSGGIFRQAHGGTLFLDEIGNLSYEVQAKLLRAIQERSIQPVGGRETVDVNVRIIAATNEDLAAKVKDRTFREDLFHRINEFRIVASPLRDRGTDLLEFAEAFREKSNQELNRHTRSFSKEVLDAFRKYEWPGNLRELKNVVQRAVLFTPGEVVEAGSIPPEMLASVNSSPATPAAGGNEFNLKTIHENQERETIAKILEQVGYNKSKAARMLNIDRKTLYSKIKQYGLE